MYRAMVKLASQGTPVTRVGIVLDSRQSIDRYWQQRVAIAEDMRCRGYRGPQEPALGGHEIGVAVGPTGALVKFRYGHHRLCIAQLLGLPRVIVTVDMMHLQWVEAWMARTGFAGLEAVRAGLGSLRSPASPNEDPGGSSR
jgi:hypothetical protein